MIRIDASSTQDAGTSRRSFLQVGATGLASFALPSLFRARGATAANGGIVKDTRVILVWLDGGPSHMDLWDLKPDAPADYRGFWRPIGTSVPGMQLTELFPKQARQAKHFSIIRSIRHDDGDHFGGAHRILTGRPGATGADTTPRYPGIGAIVSAVAGARTSGMPAHVAVPHASSVGIRPGYFGANYVGRQHDPFETEGDPNQKNFQVRNLGMQSGLSVGRLDDRRSLRKALDGMSKDVDRAGQFDVLDAFEKQAYGLLTSPSVRSAFDLAQEDEKLRDRYGRHSWGQSVLLARRLAEAGVTFTTVHMGGWDHHWDLKAGMENYLPKVDAAIAALFEDLVSRGLWEKVCVVVCGEFSRTPRMNDGSGRGTPGRDHWGNSMAIQIGGGGVKGGVIVGATDPRGEYPAERPLTPVDLHQTLYKVLGVDPTLSFTDHAGRPVHLVDGGAPIRELL
jgi:uncharacterized protein (DUF1501 family)